MVKSLLFGGGYLGICRAVICLVTKFYGFSNRKIYLIILVSAISSATLGGASMLFESRERQPEIALFIFTNSIESIYRMA